MKFTIEMIDKLSGIDFEHAAADILFHNGYRDVKVTQASGDYGVDVLARYHNRTYAIQCKRYEGNVGVKAVQEAASGAEFNRCDCAMVITNSNFTRQAITLANSTGVRLIDREGLIKLLNEYDEEYDNLEPKNAATINNYNYSSLHVYENIKGNFEQQQSSKNESYVTSENFKKSAQQSYKEIRLEKINRKKQKEGMYVPNNVVNIGMGIKLINNEIYVPQPTTRSVAKVYKNIFSVFNILMIVLLMVTTMIILAVGIDAGIIAVFVYLIVIEIPMHNYYKKIKKALNIQIVTASNYKKQQTEKEEESSSDTDYNSDKQVTSNTEIFVKKQNNVEQAYVDNNIRETKANNEKCEIPYNIESVRYENFRRTQAQPQYHSYDEYLSHKKYPPYISKRNKKIQEDKQRENMYVPNGTIKAGMGIQLINNEAYINGDINKPITCNSIRRRGLISIICGCYIIISSLILWDFSAKVGVVGIIIGFILIYSGIQYKNIFNMQVKNVMNYRRGY